MCVGGFQECGSRNAGSLPSILHMQLLYLRRFKCLRTLSLAGNPVAEAEDYKMFIYAYLPDLVYLDFRRIDDHMARALGPGPGGPAPGLPLGILGAQR